MQGLAKKNLPSAIWSETFLFLFLFLLHGRGQFGCPQDKNNYCGIMASSIPYRTYQLYVLWSCSWEPSFNLSCRSLASRLVGQAHALHLTYSSSLVVGHSPPHGSNKPFGCKSCSSSVCSCTCSTPVYKSSCLLMCCHPVLGSSVVAPNSCLG